MVAVAMSLVGVACSGGDQTNDTSTFASDPTATPAPPAAPLDNAPLPAPTANAAFAKAAIPAAPDGTPAPATTTPAPTSTTPAPTSTTPPAPPPAAAPIDDPGPKPTAACTISKDASGFFTRSTSLGSYVGYAPASYDGTKPVELVVAMHGCGDNAYNFATWGPNPYDGRATQQHIGISIDGATGNNGCWAKGADDAKILAAIDDVMSCFWVHKHRVVLAGFSSGGEIAYRVALMHADRFAGLLVESSGLYANSDEDTLVANASYKLPIAHVQHASDTVFNLGTVQADWAKLKTAGFSVTSWVTAGDHNGTSTDWNTMLIPASTGWVHP